MRELISHRGFEFTLGRDSGGSTIRIYLLSNAGSDGIQLEDQ